MSKAAQTKTLEINKELSGRRVDIVLAEFLTDLTRSQIKKLIDENMVLIGQRPIKPSTKMTEADVVEVTLPEPEPLDLTAEDLGIKLIYEDESIAVVDKPAGMTVHPGAGIKSGTLVNALLFALKNLSGIGGGR